MKGCFKFRYSFLNEKVLKEQKFCLKTKFLFLMTKFNS